MTCTARIAVNISTPSNASALPGVKLGRPISVVVMQYLDEAAQQFRLAFRAAMRARMGSCVTARSAAITSRCWRRVEGSCNLLLAGRTPLTGACMPLQQPTKNLLQYLQQNLWVRAQMRAAWGWTSHYVGSVF